MTAPALQLTGISKRYGAVQALRGVDFALAPGEIHALLGENGAGKSTLMKIAFGLVRPDTGTISLNGTTRVMRDPTVARACGLGMVHQHFTSIDAFTVAETVALAAGWRLQPRALRLRVAALSERTGLPLDPAALVRDLSAGLKQRLEVLKALAADARILLLDEPSSVLPPSEAEAFLNLVLGLRSRGLSAVLITHKLGEVFRTADRVTVLRRGEMVHTGSMAGETVAALAARMIGEAPPVAPARNAVTPGEARVRVVGLVVPRAGQAGSGLRQGTLTVRAGEVVGIAGVEGNGQRELLRAIGGLVVPAAGTLEVTGPVAFIPEDRSTEALIGEFSLTENLVLSQGAGAPWVDGVWVDWRRAATRAGELIELFGVRAAGPGATAASLSGGNQQRMVIAAALERRPGVLVAENPTRGLDIKAVEEVFQRLRDAANQGVAVVVHLTDLDELLELADRVAVVASGRVTELAPGTDRGTIGEAMLGGGV
jgi:simple sugar transport system ATP-binding protein